MTVSSSKVESVVDLFRVGTAVADKAAWKSGQITGNILAALFVAVLKVLSEFDILPIHLTDDTLNSISIVLIGVFNIALTFITSETVGMLPSKPKAEAVEE